MRIYNFVIVVGLLFGALFVQAQGKSNPRSELLECRYVYAIEQIYLGQHVKTEKKDQALQDRVVDQYLKKLDSNKVYLLQSDVDQIRKLLSNVFDKIKSRDCGVFLDVQKIVVQRVKERAGLAKKMLGKDYKFDSKVELTFDSQKKPYAKTQQEAEEFFRKYIHFQVSNYLAADTKLDEAKTNVIKFWDRAVKKIGETKEDDILASYLDAFALAMDPHSSYFSRDVNEDFRIQMSLSLEGIGATLSSQDGFTVVEALVPGGAAARSGLVKPQDKIIAVGQGEKGNMENVIEMDLRDVVKKIRGKKDTKVRLLILRKQGDEKSKIDVTLVRDKVKLEDDAASVHYLEKEVGGMKRKIAVLDLPSFYADSRNSGRTAASDLKKLIQEAKKNNAEGMVLDLSNNGGGSLDDAVKIAGLFFSVGNVVKQSSRDEMRGEITLKDNDAAVEWTGPLVVLTSRISASASEIVAGTLKDYKRAVIVGSDHTFGKGTVQTVQDIPPQTGELGAVKVTVGMFFTAGGFSTQHRGVEADVKIPGQYDLDDIGEKYLDYSLPPKQLPAFLSQEAYVKEGSQAWSMIKSEWIKTLSEKSKVRVEKSEDFKKIVTELEKAKARGKTIKISDSLKDKEKREQKKAQKNASKDDKEKEYFKRADIQESVNVLTDLMQLAGTKPLAQMQNK